MTAADGQVDFAELFKVLDQLKALKAQALDLADAMAVLESRLRTLLGAQA